MIEYSSKRSRVTISIKKDLLSRIDSLVDGLSIRSRSQAIEFILTKAIGERLNTALLLAGGKPRDISIDGNIKFLAKIGQKTLIEHVLNNLADLGISRFIIYVDYKKEEMVEHFEDLNLGYDLTFISADKATGTVKPLLMAKPHLKNAFLCAYGDTICKLNLNSMYAFHKEHSSIATMALTSVSDPRSYGVAIVEGSKVREFIEKPMKEVESYLISAGYFIFEPKIFSYIKPSYKSIERDLLPSLAQKGLLYAYPFQGLYLNVNKKADLEKAKFLL
ncbi:MAG: sugar phosphate nucleotidyltransferase [Candidatus Diapherotrites archaeon]